MLLLEPHYLVKRKRDCKMIVPFEREPASRQNDSLSRLKVAIMRMIPVFKMSPIHSFSTQTSLDGPAV